MTSMSSTAVSVVTWRIPLKFLQEKVHKRYEVDAPFVDSQAASEDQEKLGLVTLVCANFTGSKTGLVERVFDRPPHAALHLRVSVVDRVHWHRTVWGAGSVCNSLFWGKFARFVFNVDIECHHPVNISSTFNAEKGKYDSYAVDIPGMGFTMALDDTGTTLLQPDSPVVEGFSDNESALRQLGLIHEVNFYGLGRSIYRQALWNTPILPNVANVTKMEPGSLFTRFFGPDCPAPIGPPIAAWVMNEIPETKVYKMEGMREAENDMDAVPYKGQQELTRRVEVKAMRRYFKFRSEVRNKSIADLRQGEQPR